MQPIKTALCSFGMSGLVFHAPFLTANPGFEFHGVFERSKDAARQKYPDVRVYRSLEELLADESVELVIVNTPNDTHYSFAKQALLAGKHVIVEKPFTTTVEEAEELTALAKQQGRKLSVFQNRRFDSDFLTTKHVLREEILGEIVAAEIHYDRYAPALSYKVHKEIAGSESNGSLYDLGAHIIDQALQLFGWPEKLFADLRIARPDSKVVDFFDLTLYYSDPLRVRVSSGYLVREALPAFILHGRNGSFLKSRVNVQEESLAAGKIPSGKNWAEEPIAEQGILHTEIYGGIINEKVSTIPGNYMDYFEGIYRAIREAEPVPVTAESATDVIRIIRAAIESSSTQRVVSLSTF